MKQIFAVFCITFGIASIPKAGGSADIVALCIGNDAYVRDEDKLDTPVADARLMKEALVALPVGADVRLLTDASRVDIVIALNDLKERARGAKLALVYYSGHGMDGQPRGYANEDTFLLPVEAEIPTEDHLAASAVGLREVLAALKDCPVTARAVILDCCRTGAPKAVGALTAGGTKNFGLLDERVKAALGKAVAPDATLVAFAASPGRKAAAFLNTSDTNSPFTAFLAGQLRSAPGNLRDLVEAAAEQTERATEGRQVPYVSYSGATSAIRQIVFRETAAALPMVTGENKIPGTLPEAPRSVEEWMAQASRHGISSASDDEGKAWNELWITLIPARLGDYQKSRELFDELRGRFGEKSIDRDNHLGNLALIQAQKGDIRDALETCAEIVSDDRKWTTALGVGELAGKQGIRDLALEAFELATEAHTKVSESSAEIRSSINRVGQYSQIGVHLYRGGFETEGVANLEKAEYYAGRTKGNDFVFSWGLIGQRHALIGRVDESIRCLSRMTTGSNLIPAMVYGQWSHTWGHLIEAGREAEAYRLITSGRSVLSRAKSSFSSLNPSALDSSAMPFSYRCKRLAMEGRVDEAVSLFKEQQGDLQFGLEAFEVILRELLAAGKIKAAQEFIASTPNSGFNLADREEEVRKKTERPRASAVGSVAPAILQHSGEKTAEEYIASLVGDLEKYFACLKVAEYLSPIPEFK